MGKASAPWMLWLLAGHAAMGCGDSSPHAPRHDSGAQQGDGGGDADVVAEGGTEDGGDGDGPGDGDGDTPADPCDACVTRAHCLPDKTCAECVTDLHCTPYAPRCEPARHECVACLPGPDDNCPIGQYCDAVDFTCKVGCNVYRCASGVCEPDGDCSLCVSDEECSDGRVCSTRECVAACGGTRDICPSDFACCGARCAVLERDHDNCKACGDACTLSQFCGDLGCSENVLANACDAVRFTFLLDGQPVDDVEAAKMPEAFASAACSPDTPSQILEQTSSSALNQMTGQPVVGSGELVVVLGGPFGQHIIGYLESNGLTRSYNKFDGQTAWFYGRGQDGAPDPALVTAPYATLTAQHDFFVLETVTDPISRSRALKLYGLDSPGTQAAAWFFVNRVLTQAADFGGTHYIYEWTDVTGDGPSDDDTFTEIVAE